MSTLTGQYVSQSYGGLLHLSTNTGIVAGTLTSLEDGVGNALGISVRTGGQISATSFTGSLLGNASTATSATTATSASYATTATSASYAIIATSSSYALSASYAVTASYALSASFATTASYVFSSSLDPSQNTRLNTIESVTGSFATTGSNNFSGSQVITGSITYRPIVITQAFNTASINLDAGNLFTLTLIDSVTLHITATNIKAGQTANLQITQPAGVGSVTFSSAFTFPSGSSYVAFQSASAVDILSFVSFDGVKLRTVASNYFI
jgi:hypothetical protein